MNYKIDADRFVKVVDKMLKPAYGKLTPLPPEKTNEGFNEYLKKNYGDGQREYINPEDLEGELYFIPIHSEKLDDDLYPYSYVPSAKILFLNWTKDAMWDVSEMLNMPTMDLFKLYFKNKFGFDVRTISFADKRID